MTDKTRSYLLYGVMAVLILILFYNQRAGLAARQVETCKAINETKVALVTYINQQIDRAVKSLPTIEYYQEHPVELGKALSNLQRQREATAAAFAPSAC